MQQKTNRSGLGPTRVSKRLKNGMAILAILLNFGLAFYYAVMMGPTGLILYGGIVLCGIVSMLILGVAGMFNIRWFIFWQS